MMMSRAGTANLRSHLKFQQPDRTGPTKHGAFTLIELLVVVSIIALLISILLPSLKGAREQAKSVKCLAHIRGMAQAGATFANDHNGRFQLAGSNAAINYADSSRSIFAYAQNGELLAWPVALAQASGLTGFEDNFNWGVRANNWAASEAFQKKMETGFDLALCPADRVEISTPFYPNGAGLGPLPAGEPNGTHYWGRLSFGINEDIVGAEDENSNPFGNPPIFSCWKNGNRGQLPPVPGQGTAGERLAGRLELIYSPGTTLLLVDSGPDTKEQARDTSSGFANLVISAKAPGPFLSNFQVQWQKRMPRKRHPGGRLNVLFADFHGGTVKPVSFYTDSVLQGIPTQYAPNVRVSPYRPWKE